MLLGFSINYSTYLAAETNHTLKTNLEQTLTSTKEPLGMNFNEGNAEH